MIVVTESSYAQCIEMQECGRGSDTVMWYTLINNDAIIATV